MCLGTSPDMVGPYRLSNESCLCLYKNLFGSPLLIHLENYSCNTVYANIIYSKKTEKLPEFM